MSHLPVSSCASAYIAEAHDAPRAINAVDGCSGTQSSGLSQFHGWLFSLNLEDPGDECCNRRKSHRPTNQAAHMHVEFQPAPRQ